MAPINAANFAFVFMNYYYLLALSLGMLLTNGLYRCYY